MIFLKALDRCSLIPDQPPPYHLAQTNKEKGVINVSLMPRAQPHSGAQRPSILFIPSPTHSRLKSKHLSDLKIISWILVSWCSITQQYLDETAQIIAKYNLSRWHNPERTYNENKIITTRMKPGVIQSISSPFHLRRRSKARAANQLKNLSVQSPRHVFVSPPSPNSPPWLCCPQNVVHSTVRGTKNRQAPELLSNGTNMQLRLRAGWENCGEF